MAYPPGDRDVQVIFAFVPAHKSPDGIPTLTFMMPEKSWHYMDGAMCHEFDLTNLDIPLRVMIARTETHETGMALLTEANGAPLKKFKDVRHVDLQFRGKPER